jgi:flagellar hook-length control protein FliK
VGIGPFEQLQANISPEAFNRFFFKQFTAWAMQHHDSGDLIGKSAQDGTLNGQPGTSGVTLLNPLLNMPGTGTTGALWGLNPNISSSGGLNMATGLDGAQLNEDLLLKMTTLSQPAETGISENAKMTAAGHDGRLSFWASGDLNSDTLLEAQARQMGEKSQPSRNPAALKAALEQPANPNSAAEAVTAKTPEEVFGIKSAVSKSEIAPFAGLDHKITPINADSKDSGFLFSQDQLPPHLARLENAAQSSETAQRSLMPQTLNQIVQKAVLSLHNGQHEVQIDLKPDFLGHIRMQIVSEGQQVAIRIVAEFPFVKDMLENNLHQLKTELQTQGLDIDELEVSVAHDSHTESDTHQTAETAKVQAARNGTDFDDESSEKPGQSQSVGGAMAETAIDYFA